MTNPPPYARSVGNFSPIRTSTTFTWFPSLRIEAALGNIPSLWTIRTRCSQVAVVFWRSEANFVNPSINSSERLQFKNASVFRVGEAEGFDKKPEKMCRTLIPHSTASVSMRGKDVRVGTGGTSSLELGVSGYRRRTSRILVRGSFEKSSNGSSTVEGLLKEKVPSSPRSRRDLKYL